MTRERPKPDAATLEDALQIDPDALDTCLVEQPGLFYQVADRVAAANSERDGLKLDLEEKEAELDHQYREAAATAEKKATETMIRNQVQTAPKIKDLQRRFLDARTRAERALALKEAYSQRSFMLRELVAIQLAHFQNLQVERGVASHRHQLGDQNRAAAEQQRRERRASKQ